MVMLVLWINIFLVGLKSLSRVEIQIYLIGILEELDGKNNFNPDSINVIGNDVKLRLYVSLDKGTIDYIDSDITGNGKITTL